MKHLTTAVDLKKSLSDENGVIVISANAEQQVISDELLVDNLFIGLLGEKDVTLVTMGPWGSIETKGGGKLVVVHGKKRDEEVKGELFYFDNKIRFDVL